MTKRSHPPGSDTKVHRTNILQSRHLLPTVTSVSAPGALLELPEFPDVVFPVSERKLLK